MITREQVTALITAWGNGDKTELEVWQWAEQAKLAGAVADELVRDLVDTLAALPFDLITTEDVPVMLDALNNPATEVDLSVNMLWNHLDGIDINGRRYELKNHSFYGEFCDGMS